ncbi:hypothetical protein [Dyadobacter sp. 22481]|uniref:hypothetical protein n=1 Tax=Dyadobacter sp. 22481 TaxID=3453926 RepID=UPI003F8718BD
MKTQQLSFDQLADLIQSLDEVDKSKVSRALQEGFELSPEGLDELLKRLAAFDDGKLSARPWNDIKKDFGSLQHSPF